MEFSLLFYKDRIKGGNKCRKQKKSANFLPYFAEKVI